MKKYLRSFQNVEAYNAAKQGGEFYKPCVSLISGSSLQFDPLSILQLTSGTWDGSGADNGTRVFISGDVTLTGKTDCYSITFEEGGHLTISGGARLRVWKGGITNNDCTTVNYFTVHEYLHEHIYGEFLLHPDVTINNHPKATVSMHVSKGVDADNNNVWTRFITPMLNVSGWTKTYGYGTWLYLWDKNKSDWVEFGSWNNIKPFNPGSALMYKEKTEEIYSFVNNIVGNTDTILNLTSGGYWNLGNSYLGKMSIYKFVLEKFPNGNNTIPRNTGTKEGHIVIPITEGVKANPLETFIVQLIGKDSETCQISYKDLVWDPSFEEDVMPTHSLMKGALTTTNPIEIDTTLEGSEIFNDPEPVFPLELGEK